MTAHQVEILVVDNGFQRQLHRTIESLRNQTETNFLWRVIDSTSFWSEKRNQLSCADYLLYLYSGSVLEEHAVEILSRTIEALSPSWAYWDEQTQDAKTNGNPYGVCEKPDFGLIGFAGQIYTGEGVVFSKRILERMELKYTGTNFGVALREMAISAAAIADGVHIPELLLIRQGRPEADPAEQGLLRNAMKMFLSARNQNIQGIVKPDFSGLYLYPGRPANPFVSFVILSDSDFDAEQYQFGYLDARWEVIKQVNPGTYLDGCIQGAEKARGNLLCFMSADCTPPGREDMTRLINFASIPHVGAVSPCLYDGAEILYAGTFSLAGKPMCFSRQTPEPVMREIRGIRETGLPAWQFWMIDKALFLQAADSLWAGACTKTLPAGNGMQVLAAQLRTLGQSCLYLGNVMVRWEKTEQKQISQGFYEMLARYQRDFFLDPFCPPAIKARARTDVLKGVRCCFPPRMRTEGNNRKKIFVLTHELSLTGAPIVLSHAVHILVENGYQVVVASPADGELKDDFLRQNVPVLILGDMESHRDWLNFVADFDLVLVNTVVPFRQIEQLQTIPVPVLWWLHDARSGYEDYLKKVLPDSIGENIHVYSVSKYADDVVREFRPKYQTKILMYGLKDESISTMPEENLGSRKVFVSVGTVIRRKGQDILAQAVRLLPREIQEQCLFLFIGKCVDQDIFRPVMDLERDFPDAVKWIASVPHDSIFRLYRQAAAVICSSRDDPLPTFMAETMMVSGVCICSEHTGTAAVIRNGENGYVYHNDDPKELADCISQVVNCDHADAVRQEARKTFETMFSMDIFKDNLLSSVEDCINAPRKGT